MCFWRDGSVFTHLHTNSSRPSDRVKLAKIGINYSIVNSFKYDHNYIFY